MNFVFIYLGLFAMTYIPPIIYVRNWNDCVSSKSHMSWYIRLTWWYVYRTAKEAEYNIPIHGSASSTYVSYGLYVRTIFPSSLWILSTINFDWEVPGEYGLVLIPYSSSVKLFLNSWPMNYPPQLYVIYTGQEYLTNHIFSTKFSIIISFLSLYCINSNHLVTGLIILTYFNINNSFPLWRSL